MIRSAQPTLHGHDAAAWRHSHRFVEARPRAERRTLYAVLLTAAMMVAEILGGWWTGSMALLADGWHMSTHVLALGIALAAYVIARRLGEDPRFTFGTWKIEILGSFASALLLGVVGVLVVVESVRHLLAPVDIHYNEALWVTAIGLAVNVVCALWLAGAHDHGHGPDHAHGPAGTRRHDDDHDRDKERNKERDDTHEHETPHRDHDHDRRREHDHEHQPEHDHDEHRHRDHPQEAALHRRRHAAHAHSHDAHGHHHPHHHDLNLRAAYLHVMADAATSVLALAALFTGKYLGLRWIDPMVGIVGALVIGQWAYGLLKRAGGVLLDRGDDPDLQDAIQRTLEAESGVVVSDLHLWRVGPSKFACVIALASPSPQSPDRYKAGLAHFDTLVHVTVEVNHCCELAGQAPAHA
ncbi:cation diffusion facilitator family transporter [Ralstonia solanacearum]|uniref:cation diffusion facilitator family transporter n=1 Tax=Ralstonia solanacearum TaxID=305 RepID=UPI0005C65674|nr:cation diffusion facilitator family transporter [Ralstonia solanacearum]MBB6590336.1 cation transporter [Ralstonia solanacearum]MBB6594534.1 cation transporter [Ralstonia solanacearum]MDB0539663.1 cation diffusion facilitator family transporter [Ralstonia solanacearum]MDB0549546.1 cation diffusion facilitator family transporter [Ralstonia solanacearum]MDB0554636.1 cation diffusion facilitator family transporter [Ralstonia solanacearum]